MDVFKDAHRAVAFAADKMKKVNLFETERMFCDVYGLEPGQEQKGHAHAGADKIYYVIDGRALFRIDDDERELAVGEIAFAPAGSQHGVRNASDKRTSLLVFMAPKP